MTGLALTAGGLLPAAASADTSGPCAGSGTLSVSGNNATCMYPAASNGGFIVPTGVSSISIQAIGGRGGNGSDPSATSPASCESPVGGSGGEVESILSVSHGALLQVRVGDNGESACLGGGGGYGGGGNGNLDAGGAGGGGGGGATTLTASGGTTPLIVAAGGGGAGSAHTGYDQYVAGGAAGYPSGSVGGSYVGGGAGGFGGGGGGGTQTAGGAGGEFGSPCSSAVGGAGSSFEGGRGAERGTNDAMSGAGGGAGYYGGGGSAAAEGSDLYGDLTACSYGSPGGGGGSDYGPSGASFTATTAGPAMQITFTTPAPKVTVNCPGTDANVATTCVVTVTGDSVGGAPAGTVTVTSDHAGTFSGSPCTLGPAGSTSSQCSVSYSQPTNAKVTISAAFTPSGGIYGAANGSGTLYVANALSTTTTVSCSPSTLTAGQSTSCTATVDMPAVHTGYPSGMLAFSTDGDGMLSESSCTLSGGTITTGFAECAFTYATKTTSGDTITAVYEPTDPTTQAPSSGDTTLTINPVTPTATDTKVSCSPSALTVGATTSCTATVDLHGVRAGYPQGTLKFAGSGGGTLSASSCALSGGPTSTGSASCNVTYVTKVRGSDSVTATYAPLDPASTAASAGSATLTVAAHPTDTSVACAPATVVAGAAIVCTATTDLHGQNTGYPAGTVQFVTSGSGKFSKSSCTLSGGTSSVGAASCGVTYTSGTKGSDTITAAYVPSDPQTVGASSGTATVTINSATTTPPPKHTSGTPSFGPPTVSGSAATIPVTCAGTAGTVCELTSELTAVETLRAGKVIGINARRRRPAVRHKRVVLGRQQLTVPAGGSAQMKTTLNATGRRPLREHHRLRARLAVSEAGGMTATSRTVTFTAAPKRKRKHG